MTEHEQSQGHREERSRVPVWLIIAGIILVFAAIFVLQNTESITMEFLMFEHSMPLWVMLVIFFVLGFVLAEIWGYMRRRRRRTPVN